MLSLAKNEVAPDPVNARKNSFVFSLNQDSAI